MLWLLQHTPCVYDTSSDTRVLRSRSKIWKFVLTVLHFFQGTTYTVIAWLCVHGNGFGIEMLYQNLLVLSFTCITLHCGTWRPLYWCLCLYTWQNILWNVATLFIKRWCNLDNFVCYTTFDVFLSVLNMTSRLHHSLPRMITEKPYGSTAATFFLLAEAERHRKFNKLHPQPLMNTPTRSRKISMPAMVRPNGPMRYLQRPLFSSPISYYCCVSDYVGTCNSWTLFRRFLRDLEDWRALRRIPSAARVLQEPQGLLNCVETD